MKYILEIPDNLAEMDYEEQRIAVLKAWEENRRYACQVSPEGSQTIDRDYYCCWRASDEKSEG